MDTWKKRTKAVHAGTRRSQYGEVSEAVYLDDPDGNGIELYRDRPAKDWPRDAAGNLSMVNAPLDVDALIREGMAR